MRGWSNPLSEVRNNVLILQIESLLLKRIKVAGDANKIKYDKKCIQYCSR